MIKCLIIALSLNFVFSAHANQISLGFNSSKLSSHLKMKSENHSKKITTCELSFNEIFQKLQSNEICIGILPLDLTYQYLVFGHPGEVRGKFAGDAIVEVDLKNSIANNVGLTSGGYVEMIAKESKRKNLRSVPKKKIIEILSGTSGAGELNKILINLNDIDAGILSGLKYKKIKDTNFYVVMNFSCGFDETDNATDLLNQLFTVKIKPLSGADLQIFEGLAKASDNKLLLKKLSVSKGYFNR